MNNNSAKKSGQNEVLTPDRFDRFKIDFFELSFLCEVCIPPVPIARSMFFDKMIDVYYYQMTQDERNRIFDWMKKSLDLKQEKCRIFYSRYNPENQYSVEFKFGKKTDKVECFLMDGKYYTQANKFVSEEYILNVEKINLKQ